MSDELLSVKAHYRGHAAHTQELAAKRGQRHVGRQPVKRKTRLHDKLIRNEYKIEENDRMECTGWAQTLKKTADSTRERTIAVQITAMKRDRSFSELGALVAPFVVAGDFGLIKCA